MDHQGAGGRRSAADTRRQPPWPSLEGTDGSGVPEGRDTDNTGPLPARSPGYGASGYGPTGSGAQRVLGPATGPQRFTGSASGAQPVLSSGSGAHRVLGPGTGPGRLIDSASGSQPVLPRGSGAQPVLPRGSGAQPALGAPGVPQGAGSTGPWGRTPVQGYPPRRGSAEPFPGGLADAYLDDDTQLAPAGGAGQADRPGRRRGGRTKRRFRSRSWLAAAVVVVAAAGFASYWFLYEPTVNAPVSPSLRLPTTAPGSPSFDKTLGKWQHIGTRAEDPEPLTIAGL